MVAMERCPQHLEFEPANLTIRSSLTKTRKPVQEQNQGLTERERYDRHWLPWRDVPGGRGRERGRGRGGEGEGEGEGERGRGRGRGGEGEREREREREPSLLNFMFAV